MGSSLKQAISKEKEWENTFKSSITKRIKFYVFLWLLNSIRSECNAIGLVAKY